MCGFDLFFHHDDSVLGNSCPILSKGQLYGILWLERDAFWYLFKALKVQTMRAALEGKAVSYTIHPIHNKGAEYELLLRIAKCIQIYRAYLQLIRSKTTFCRWHAAVLSKLEEATILVGSSFCGDHTTLYNHFTSQLLQVDLRVPANFTRCRSFNLKVASIDTWRSSLLAVSSKVEGLLTNRHITFRVKRSDSLHQLSEYRWH